MRSMRPLLLVLAAAALLPATASALSANGQIESAAPIHLFGEANASGNGTKLFHYAHADDTLSGTVWVGTLYDHSTSYVKDGQQFACDWYDGQTFVDVIEEFNGTSGQVQDSAFIGLGHGGFAHFSPDASSLRFAVGAGPGDASKTFGFLGPNPQHSTSVTIRAGSIRMGPYITAFPTSAFILVPDRSITLTDAGTLVIPWGTLRLRINSVDYAYEAEVRNETRPPPPSGFLPAPQPYTCELEVYHTLVLEFHSGALQFTQAGVERVQAYWDGQAAAAQSGNGDYDVRRGDDYGKSLQAGALPATTVAAEDLVVRVDGRLRLQDAFGSLSIDGAFHRAENTTLTLDGRLEAAPRSRTDDGQGMITDLRGDVKSFQNVAGRPREEGVGEYAPYILGAAGGIGVVGLAYLGWPMLKLKGTQLLLFPLYARLRKEDILENPLRDDILEAVDKTPGISASELGRRLNCGWGTLVYHLTVLERMQLIASAREGRHKRFFVQGRINYSDKSAAGLIANPAARIILDAVQANPGIIQRDLGRFVDLSAGTVAWHIERLSAAGLVVKEEDGRVVRYYPSTKLLELTKQMAA